MLFRIVMHISMRRQFGINIIHELRVVIGYKNERALLHFIVVRFFQVVDSLRTVIYNDISL